MINNKDLVLKSLDIISSKGCKNARVTLSQGKQTLFSVRDLKLDRLQNSESTSLYIQLYNNGKYGAFSTNKTSLIDLDNFIDKALSITKLINTDECRDLPHIDSYYKGDKTYVDLCQYDNSIDSISNEEKIENAINSCSEVDLSNSIITSINCDFSDYKEYSCIADTNGFIGESKISNFFINGECSIKGENDSRPEGWWSESSIFYTDLKKEGVCTKAYERALSRLNSRKVKSKKYNLIIENIVVSRLIAPILSALNGGSIQQNNSFLIDSLGKKIFSDKLNIFDSAHQKIRSGSRYFDSEGVKTTERYIIENGIVNLFFINSYFSKKLNMPITIESSSVPTLEWKSGLSLDLPTLISQTDEAILVNGFNGGNVNSTTGDFSFGINGFYVRNGIIKHPINEMNITGNIIELWSNLEMVCSDFRESGKWILPSVMFGGVNFNGL